MPLTMTNPLEITPAMKCPSKMTHALGNDTPIAVTQDCDNEKPTAMTKLKSYERMLLKTKRPRSDPNFVELPNHKSFTMLLTGKRLPTKIPCHVHSL